MKLPSRQRAYIERAKITEYLLSATSPRGRAKAKFFVRFGFSVERWPEFADALRMHGRDGSVARVSDSVHGNRYYVEGTIRTPDGRNPRVVTVWQLDTGNDSPRLITAFPAKGRH